MCIRDRLALVLDVIVAVAMVMCVVYSFSRLVFDVLVVSWQACSVLLKQSIFIAKT